MTAWEITQVKGAPSKLELQRAHTPLRHSQFERELARHPNKLFASYLLTALHDGVDIGYTGPRGPQNAKNLQSASLHPHVIDKELAKECAAGRVLGPFTHRPFKNLGCGSRTQKTQQMVYDNAPISPSGL